MVPSIEERIKEIEDEIRKTPKNKGTEAHLAKLKSKLAALKELLQTRKSSQKGHGKVMAVKKQGNATISMIGFPSVGKSSLLNILSNANSKTGEYAFTTITLVPGMMFYKGAYIQIFDLPGIIENASKGIGMGREILSYARSSDLLLLIIDPTQNISHQLKVIMQELHDAGFRINKQKPDITITKKSHGGLDIFIAQHLDIREEEVREICYDFNIHNADIIIRDAESIEDVYDAFFSNRIYIKAIIVINKIDLLDKKTLEDLKEKHKDWVFISTKTGEGIEHLKERIFNELNLIRVYTKKPLQKIDDVDKDHPLILRRPAYVKDVAEKLNLMKVFKYARVWGKSVKFGGQKVGLDHELEDEDIVELSTK